MFESKQAALRSTGETKPMLLGVQANGILEGRLLVMTLEQRYRNSSNANTEITYTFPLPYGAVLMEVEVTLNGQVLKGEVTARTVARERYEEAISDGNSGIMLEKNLDGSFTLELGNLMAQEECCILIRYSQVLATIHGQIRLMLPTTIAPRYGDAISDGGFQPHQVPVTDLRAEYPFDITLTLLGELASADVASPSHKTSYSRAGNGLVIRLSQNGYLDRDFILVVSSLKNTSDALLCNDACVEGQAALLVAFSPSFPSQVAHTMSAKVLVDCSGSMAGDSISAARRALNGIVAALGSEDRFSLSSFGSTVQHRSAVMWNGTLQAKASAKRWIDKLNANMGGTEMEEALTSTIALAKGVSSDILLITDGEIHAIDKVIEVAIKANHRVFVVAIGASPAESHLRRLASSTGGCCDFVAPGENVEPAVLRMSARMHSPLATDVRVEWPTSYAMRWQQPVPDFLFASETLNLFAFLDAPAKSDEPISISLWGRLDGFDQEVQLAQAVVSLCASHDNTLARMTAYEQCQSQIGQECKIAKTEKRSPNEVLAMQYRLITQDTNFILVHPRSDEEKALEMPSAHRVSQMMPAGWGGSSFVMSGGLLTSPILGVVTGATISQNFMRNLLVAVGSSSLWRTNRSSSNSVPAMDIPDFLRMASQPTSKPKKAPVFRERDKKNTLYWVKDSSSQTHGNEYSYCGITPAGLAHWLNVNDKLLWPESYLDLERLGLGLAIREWLEFELGVDHPESTVVHTFLMILKAAMFDHDDDQEQSKNAFQVVADTAGPKSNGVAINSDLAMQIGTALQTATARSWPDTLVMFPQVI